MKKTTKTLYFIMILALALAPTATFAQTSSASNSIQEKREATKNAIEEKQNEIRENLKSTKERIEERKVDLSTLSKSRQEAREAVTERRLIDRTDRIARIVNRAYDNLERLEDLTDRTEGQVEKLTTHGYATDEARVHLTNVEIELASIEENISVLKLSDPTALLLSKEERETVKKIDTSMREVRHLLINAVESLKASAESGKVSPVISQE